MMRIRPVAPRALVLAAVLAGSAFAEEAPRNVEQKERAVAALEQAIKADPNNAELWVLLAFANRKLDRIDKAQEAFEKASSLDPRNQESLYMLGLIYEKKDRKADALRVWKQYLEVSTNPEKRAVAEKHIHHLSQ